MIGQITRHASLQTLEGVGPKISEKLEKIGLLTYSDILFHLPLRYVNRTELTAIKDINANHYAVIEGFIESNAVVFGRKRSFICKVTDNTGSIVMRLFRFSNSQKNQLKTGSHIRCFGTAQKGPSGLEFYHPEYILGAVEKLPPLDRTLSPIYPSTSGISQNKLRQISKLVFEHLKPISSQITQFEDLKFLHNPPADVDLKSLELGINPIQKKLALEELTAFQIGFLTQRQTIKNFISPPIKRNLKFEEIFLKNLEFQMTNAQHRVVSEIATDISSSKPMLRLIQGDVGSGKTVVAAFCALQLLANNKQIALMAPTEILAEQHRQNFVKWLAPFDYKVELLSGKIKGTNRTKINQKLENGSINVIIGTHALFQENVKFHALGLIIIDEQHRFGVGQRLALLKKGFQAQLDTSQLPNQLIMTATPIPRTLAMSAYADLDFSVIDELPPGRKPINTSIISGNRRDQVIRKIKDIILEGNQAYWVCTLIEESDNLEAQAAEVISAELKLALPELSIGLIHGRLKAKEKIDIINKFKKKEVSLLVATTVIEVGIDAPNATVMIIENAERLGLSQLHQLRGRVGRGDVESFCILMYDKLSTIGQKRMQIMRETNDGFKIAEADLELRGAGEILGTRQTGDIFFKIAELPRDASLLTQAKKDAKNIIDNDPGYGKELVRNWLSKAEDFSLA